MGFMQNVKNMLNNEYNTSVTENGAVGYRTSGKALLDLNFAVSSLRNASSEEIVNRFIKAYYEEPKLAIRWLFLPVMCVKVLESADSLNQSCWNWQRAVLNLPRL